MLRNNGQQDVYQDPSQGLPSQHPWFLVIVGDKRRDRLPMTELGNRPYPQTRGQPKHVVIHPGEQFRQDYDLAQWFVFPGPGTYKVLVLCRASLDSSGVEHFDMSAGALVRIIDAPDNQPRPEARE
jgi:hypothetical protein